MTGSSPVDYRSGGVVEAVDHDGAGDGPNDVLIERLGHTATVAWRPAGRPKRDRAKRVLTESSDISRPTCRRIGHERPGGGSCAMHRRLSSVDKIVLSLYAKALTAG